MVVDEKRERVDLVVVDGVQSVIDGEFLRRSFGIDRASLSQLSLSADMRVQSLHRTICLLSLWFLNALAVDLHGRVLWNDVCSNATALGRAKVVLDSGNAHAGAVTESGAFTIFDVPAGTYLMSVNSHDYVFDQLRIDVVKAQDSSTDFQAVEVRPYIAGTPLDPPSTITLPYPITLSVKHKFGYFTPVESFNILSMLSSPMTLMMVFGAVMMIATPYMLKNMDPEMMEDFKKEQAKMAGVQSALASGDFKSGISAIMAAAEEESAGPSSSAMSAGGKVSQKAGKNSKKSRR